MAAHKPSVYLDTNIFSVLHYRGGDPIVMNQRNLTRSWWEIERVHFTLFTSRETERELAQGVYASQASALAEARRVSFLRFNKSVIDAKIAYLNALVVPISKPIDAFQLAFASVHMIDYLLTWNHAHLARPDVHQKLEAINRKYGWRTPILATPSTMPRKSLGQEIRRQDG
jgi:hypothetical protein